MRQRDTHFSLILPLGVLLCSGYVCAQQPPDAGAVLQQQRQLPSDSSRRQQLPDQTDTMRPALKATGGMTVLIKSIRFTGGEGLAENTELQAQVGSAIGRQMDMGQLDQLAELITRFLRDKGWFLAFAYLPAQDVTEGNIEIAIIRGRIDGGSSGDGVDIQSQAKRLGQQRIRGTLRSALFDGGTDAVNNARLERALLLLNDLPVISATSTLEKGKDPGASRLVVKVDEGAFATGHVSADNYGSRYTGPDRVVGGASLNSPLGMGDQLTLSGNATRWLELLSISYALPIGYDGTRFGMTYSAMSYQLDKSLVASDTRGIARTQGLNVSYPFVRTRNASLRGQVAYEQKALRDESLSVIQRDRRVSTLGLTASGDNYDSFAGGGLNNFSFGLTFIDADLSRVASDVVSDANPKAAGSSRKFNLSVTRLQSLSKGNSLLLSLTAQAASKNLVSSEKYALGGPTGIRAYPGGEASGDEAALATLEMRHDVSGAYLGGHFQFIGFIDTGFVRGNKHPWLGSAGNATNSNSYRLSGAGIGLNFSKAGAWTARAVLATKLGDNPGRAAVTNLDSDGRKNDQRMWLQAMLWF